MTRYLFWLLALAACLPLSAQQQRLKFTVESFSWDQFSRAAQEHKRLDGDNKPMAIIKVTSDNPDDLTAYSFDFGNLRSDQPELHDDVLWIYVQQKAHYVTIKRPGYVTVSRYELEPEIESGKTYTMRLSAQARRVETQMVQFRVEPADAKAMVLVKSSKATTEQSLGITDENGATEGKRLEYETYTYRVIASDFMIADGQFTLSDKTQTHIESVVLKPNFADITLTTDANADIYVNDELKGTGQWTGRLATGHYTVECRKDRCRPTLTTISVEVGQSLTYTLSAPTPITGSLSVTSRPSDADITVDGQPYGQTPRIINDIIIGDHQVWLSKPGYGAQQQSVTVEEGQVHDITFQLERSSNPKKVKKPKEPKPEKQPNLKKALAGEKDDGLLPASAIYLQVGMQAGSLMAATVSVGAYISGFNIEASYGLGLSKETVYWNHTSSPDVSPVECVYKPTLLGVKLGYGIAAGRSLRLTPQAGFNIVNIKASEADSKGYASTASIGLRAELALARHFSVYAAPEMGFAVSKSDTYEQLADLSSTIKNWSGGFNVRAGICISF